MLLGKAIRRIRSDYFWGCAGLSFLFFCLGILIAIEKECRKPKT